MPCPRSNIGIKVHHTLGIQMIVATGTVQIIRISTAYEQVIFTAAANVIPASPAIGIYTPRNPNDCHQPVIAIPQKMTSSPP